LRATKKSSWWVRENSPVRKQLRRSLERPRRKSLDLAREARMEKRHNGLQDDSG
jgi:hypothetical protein